MQLTLSDFDYHLPQENIAQFPASPRDRSRLLQVGLQNSDVTDHHFYELDQLLPKNAVLVRNNTKVIPARIFGHKITGGLVEVLLTRRLSITNSGTETWECLTKPGLKVDQKVSFGTEGSLSAVCTSSTGYTRELTFNQGKEALFASLYELGKTPIPPYIHWNSGDELELRERYQTLYAKIAGSAAAPTAGLHFTSELESRLLEKGIEILELTLHVGLGTFLPVKTEDITKHHLHKEWFSLSETVAAKINSAKQENRKIIAVGTTSTRVLETCADQTTGLLLSGEGETQIYIYPPYKFRIIDGLITNFHLPKSSLLMMITAFMSQPNTTQEFSHFADSQLGKAYKHAIENGYRFYSFGDAMLIG